MMPVCGCLYPGHTYGGQRTTLRSQFLLPSCGGSGDQTHVRMLIWQFLDPVSPGEFFLNT